MPRASRCTKSMSNGDVESHNFQKPEPKAKEAKEESRMETNLKLRKDAQIHLKCPIKKEKRGKGASDTCHFIIEAVT